MGQAPIVFKKKVVLFIVLWLLNSSKQVRVAVGGYFKDPTGKSKKVGNGENGTGKNFVVTKENMDKIKDELAAAIHKVDITEKLKDQIEMPSPPKACASS